MAKLTKGTDVEYRTTEGLLKLTASGVAQFGQAIAAAPALWASLQ